MEDRGTRKIDNTCTGKKECEVYRKLRKRFTMEETTKDTCDLYTSCPHFNPIKWIKGPEDALEELLRMPAVMIDYPGARKLGALRFGIEATKRMIPKSVKTNHDGFGNGWAVCPTCGASNVYNIFHQVFPYCPLCGQKLKEAEDEQTE